MMMFLGSSTISDYTVYFFLRKCMQFVYAHNMFSCDETVVFYKENSSVLTWSFNLRPPVGVWCMKVTFWLKFIHVNISQILHWIWFMLLHYIILIFIVQYNCLHYLFVLSHSGYVKLGFNTFCGLTSLILESSFLWYFNTLCSVLVSQWAHQWPPVGVNR